MSGAVQVIKRAASGPLDVVKAAASTAALAFDPSTYKDPAAALKKAVNINLQPIKNAATQLENDADYMGIRKSSAHKKADAMAEDAQNEENARGAAYNDAISDKNIDSLTQAEIVKMYQNGGGSREIASYLSSARAGKGVFGVRRINQNQAGFQAGTPGRSQTLGGGSIL